jgi:hypothetical protein
MTLFNKGDNMNNSRKYLVLVPILLFILACQAVMRPIEQAQGAGSTAVAAATDIVNAMTQVSGFATEAGDFVTQISPIGTAIGIPTDMMVRPDFFNPQDPPLTEWNGIPVMPEAIAGDESDGLYGYTIKVEVKAVEEFYAGKLPALGWTEQFSMPGTSGMAILVYQKDNQTLTVTITSLQDHLLVMFTLQ